MTKRKKLRQATRVLNDERRIDWLIGRNVEHRSQLDVTLANWAGLTADLNDVLPTLRLAFSPAGPPILLALLSAAWARPGRDGLASAYRSARQIWREVWVEPKSEKKDRRPVEWTERDMFHLWILFHGALAHARQARPSLGVDAFQREYVETSKRGRGYRRPDGRPLTTASQLDAVLKRVEKRFATKAERARTLKYLLPETFESLGPAKRKKASAAS